MILRMCKRYTIGEDQIEFITPIIRRYDKSRMAMVKFYKPDGNVRTTVRTVGEIKKLFGVPKKEELKIER